MGKGQTLHLYTRPQCRNNNCGLRMTLKAVQREQPTTWRLIHKGLPSNNSSITSFAMTKCSPEMRESNVASRADVHPSTVQSELTQGSAVQRKFRGPILRQQNKLSNCVWNAATSKHNVVKPRKVSQWGFLAQIEQSPPQPRSHSAFGFICFHVVTFDHVEAPSVSSMS